MPAADARVGEVKARCEQRRVHSDWTAVERERGFSAFSAVMARHRCRGNRTQKPVYCGDGDNIAVGEGRRQLPKLRPVGGRVGDLLAEPPFRTRPLSVGQAGRSGLGSRSRRGHSRKSCRRCASELCIKKGQSYQRFSFEPNILTAAG
jgi:hypothetical protein